MTWNQANEVAFNSYVLLIEGITKIDGISMDDALKT